MSASLLLILSLFTAVAAMCCLSLAMDKHSQSIFSLSLSVAKQRLLRATGWLLVTIALVLCMATWGAVIGVVAWVGELTIGYVAVVLWLAWPVGLRSKA